MAGGIAGCNYSRHSCCMVEAMLRVFDRGWNLGRSRRVPFETRTVRDGQSHGSFIKQLTVLSVASSGTLVTELRTSASPKVAKVHLKFSGSSRV